MNLLVAEKPKIFNNVKLDMTENMHQVEAEVAVVEEQEMLCHHQQQASLDQWKVDM